MGRHKAARISNVHDPGSGSESEAEQDTACDSIVRYKPTVSPTYQDLEAMIVIANQEKRLLAWTNYISNPFRNTALCPPAAATPSQLLAAKVVGSKDRTQIRLLLKSPQIIPHPMPIT
jgi:hypothetical protein